MATVERTLFERYDDIRQRTGQAPICRASHFERAAKRADGQMEFILSTPGIKRDGFEIVQSGWQFGRFEKSGSLALWRHSTWDPTDILGNWTKVWRSSAAGMPQHLRGLLDWLSEEKNVAVPPIRAMYEDGNLRCTSVSWQDTGADSIEKITPDELEGENVASWVKYYGGVRFLVPELIEASLCMLGMDPDAVAARCRSGAIPQPIVGKFAANWREALKTEDGREILSLDGHPARFEVERRAIVDLGAAGQEREAEPVEDQGKPIPPPFDTYTEPGLLLADMQHVMRGSKQAEGLREHLAASAATLEVAVPWESAMGRSYESLHAELASAPEAQRPALRKTIEQVGAYVFGEARLREAWEPRALPPGLADVWQPASEAIERVLRAAGEEPADVDTLTDALLAEMGRAAAPAMETIGWMLRTMASIERAAGMPITMNDEPSATALVERITALRAAAETPPVETTPSPAPATRRSDEDQPDEAALAESVQEGVQRLRLKRLKRRQAARTPGAGPSESLFNRVTSRASGATRPALDAPNGETSEQ